MKGFTMQVARIVTLLCPLLILACDGSESTSGQVQDEATKAGRDAASFKAADDTYFRDMDGGILTDQDKAEIRGRNMWLVWTGGNDRFWDRMTIDTFGAFDLLKTLSSFPYCDPKTNPNPPANCEKTVGQLTRDHRWNYLGLVNEPCFDKAAGPDPDHYGLWLDKRRADCGPDPFADEKNYPGVAIGARGKNIPVGSYYGIPSGIVGLRLFPNPDFDEAAATKWDPVKFYTDPTYYKDKDLVRPYRVGMSCAFCHVGPSPIKPPADPENPKWENLSSTVGAQYFWIDRIFAWAGEGDADNFIYQLLHTSRPGSLDTSLVSTDNINNPRTMNAIYSLLPRLGIAMHSGKETLAGGELDNKQFNDYVKEGPLTQFFQPPDTVFTPRVLKDGSDAVGALGALNRVYLNIGLFSEEWLLHFRPFVGGKPITPIKIADAEKNSAYWRATEAQTLDMARFFLKAGQPDHLTDAPGGDTYLTKDPTVLEHGKVVFAERCARCHSSKGPELPAGLDFNACNGPGYLDCWNKYWDWTKTDEYKAKMRSLVLADDFLDGNYLSTELRVPVTLLQTNACSPLATNALEDNIWDNFSSQSYKHLPSVGTITYYDPFTGEPHDYLMPAGGRGYTRPPSLISLWSTAPFLLNNRVGQFNPSPSVEARMTSFQSSIEQMLWPEKREKDPVLGDKIPGLIDRTTETSYIIAPAGYLPDGLKPLTSWLYRLLPSVFTSWGDVKIGPIPKGTPVDLLANLSILRDKPDLEGHLDQVEKVLALFVDLKSAFESLPANAGDEEAKKIFMDGGLKDRMLALSKCPDFIVNRGHYFGTDRFAEEPALSDQEKRDLIEFLKTF